MGGKSRKGGTRSNPIMNKQDITEQLKKLKEGDFVRIIWKDTHTKPEWIGEEEFERWSNSCEHYFLQTIGHFLKVERDRVFVCATMAIDSEEIAPEDKIDAKFNEVWSIPFGAIKEIKILSDEKQMKKVELEGGK